jgi:hypothetical protein
MMYRIYIPEARTICRYKCITLNMAGKHTRPYSKKDKAGRRLWFSADGKRISKAKAYKLLGKKLHKTTTRRYKKKPAKGSTQYLKRKIKKLKKQLNKKPKPVKMSSDDTRWIYGSN